jgi:hypothetical protein
MRDQSRNLVNTKQAAAVVRGPTERPTPPVLPSLDIPIATTRIEGNGDVMPNGVTSREGLIELQQAFWRRRANCRSKTVKHRLSA